MYRFERWTGNTNPPVGRLCAPDAAKNPNCCTIASASPKIIAEASANRKTGREDTRTFAVPLTTSTLVSTILLVSEVPAGDPI